MEVDLQDWYTDMEEDKGGRIVGEELMLARQTKQPIVAWMRQALPTNTDGYKTIALPTNLFVFSQYCHIFHLF